MKASDKTIKLVQIAREKERIINGYASNQIGNDFNNLLDGKYVEVGYRAGCGRTDRTHKVFDQWVKVLKSLRKDGFVIEEKSVTHLNKSPTMAQGFWNSNIYSLKTEICTEEKE